MKNVAIIKELVSGKFVTLSGLGPKRDARTFENYSNAMRMAGRLNRQNPSKCFGVTWKQK